jgi:hypothetical protein
VWATTNQILYEGIVDLDSGLFHEPINFDKDGSNISERDWTAMITKATLLLGINTDNANSVKPLSEVLLPNNAQTTHSFEPLTNSDKVLLAFNLSVDA